jgi:hypothetical protein
MAVLQTVQRRIFVLFTIYYWGDQIKEYVTHWTCRMYNNDEKFIQVSKSECKRPLKRLWHKWEDNIKTDLKGIECDSIDWIQQDRVQCWILVNIVINLQVL